MVAMLTHPGVSTKWLKQIIAADLALDVAGSLRNLRVTTFSNEQKALSGVYHPQIPQSVSAANPAVVIGIPFPVSLWGRMFPNGDNIGGVGIGQDVLIEGRDIPLDDAGLEAMLARIVALANGNNGPVTGGEVTHCRLSDGAKPYLPSQFINKGTYVYVQVGANFTLATKTT
jgi:hypothetical protein